MPDGQAFDLTDTIPYAPLPALGERPTRRLNAPTHRGWIIKAPRRACKAAELARKAADADRLPTADFNGNYGGHWTCAGQLARNLYRRRSVSASTVFQGGTVRNEVLQADAELEQPESRAGRFCAGEIAYEIRAAYLDLESAGRTDAGGEQHGRAGAAAAHAVAGQVRRPA